MVDLTRDQHGRIRARLLDLVPGRSGKAYADWLTDRGEAFRAGVKVATLDPFHGYKNAIDDQLEDAVAVLDAFHVVKLGTAAVDECRRRVQQETTGHRGRKGDPLYGIRKILRLGLRSSPTSSGARLEKALAARRRAPARSRSPGRAPSSSAPPTVTATRPRAARSPRRSSRPSRPVRSPRSPDSAAP